MQPNLMFAINVHELRVDFQSALDIESVNAKNRIEIDRALVGLDDSRKSVNRTDTLSD
jgi:hypothetical protein